MPLDNVQTEVYALCAIHCLTKKKENIKLTVETQMLCPYSIVLTKITGEAFEQPTFKWKEKKEKKKNFQQTAWQRHFCIMQMQDELIVSISTD